MRILAFISLFVVQGCVQTTIFQTTRLQNPSHVEQAFEYIGLEEREDRQVIQQLVGVNPVRVEWCAAFVSAILEQNGYSSTESLLARSYIYYGDIVSEEDVQIGDIMVFTRGQSLWKGHVGFFVGTEMLNGREYYRILGGNQGNEVNIGLYPKYRLLAIRRPVPYSV